MNLAKIKGKLTPYSRDYDGDDKICVLEYNDYSYVEKQYEILYTKESGLIITTYPELSSNGIMRERLFQFNQIKGKPDSYRMIILRSKYLIGKLMFYQTLFKIINKKLIISSLLGNNQDDIDINNI